MSPILGSPYGSIHLFLVYEAILSFFHFLSLSPPHSKNKDYYLWCPHFIGYWRLRRVNACNLIIFFFTSHISLLPSLHSPYKLDTVSQGLTAGPVHLFRLTTSSSLLDNSNSSSRDQVTLPERKPLPSMWN